MVSGIGDGVSVSVTTGPALCGRQQKPFPLLLKITHVQTTVVVRSTMKGDSLMTVCTTLVAVKTSPSVTTSAPSARG